MKPFVGAKVAFGEGGYYIVTRVTETYFCAQIYNDDGTDYVNGQTLTFPHHSFLTAPERLVNRKEYFIKKFKELYESSRRT